MKGNEAYIEPTVENGNYRFRVKSADPGGISKAQSGTKLSRGANFQCLISGVPISGDYIKSEGEAGRMGVRLMAIVVDGARGRVYLAPNAAMEQIALQAKPQWKPHIEISGSTQYLGIKPYGMKQFSQLFTDRQLVALTTFADLFADVRKCVEEDSKGVDFGADDKLLDRGGRGGPAYADAIAVYLSLVASSLADRMSTICSWDAGGATWGTKTRNTFSRQAIK